MTFTSDERIAMADACRQAAGSAGIGSDQAKDLIAAARIMDADAQTAWFPHELAQFAHACTRAASALRGVTAETARRKAGLDRAAAYLNALASTARQAPPANPPPPTAEPRQEWAAACNIAASRYTSSSDMHLHLSEAAQLLEGTLNPANVSPSSLAAIADACLRAAGALAVTADTKGLADQVPLLRTAAEAITKDWGTVSAEPPPRPRATPGQLHAAVETVIKNWGTAATPRLPLNPLRLTISCAPEGGWIAEGDTQHFEHPRPLAAFSSAADLLPWLGVRLHQHENPAPAPQPESETAQ